MDGGDESPANQANKKLTKKVRKPHCTTCRKPTKNHDGPLGRNCKSRPLISFNERDDVNENDTVDIEVEEEEQVEQVEEVNSSQEDQSENVIVYKNVTIPETVAQDSIAEMSAAGGTSHTLHVSTPRGLPISEFVRGPTTDELLLKLGDQVARLEVRFDELCKRTTAIPQQVPIYTAASTSTAPSATMHDVVPMCSAAMPTNIVDHVGGANAAACEPAVASPAPHRLIPGLLPVPDNVDLSCIPVHGKFSQDTVQKVIKGEFIYIDELLPVYVTNASKNISELVLEDGKMEFKMKNEKRKVVDAISWLEGWCYYEEIMVWYHGFEAYKRLGHYKRKIINYTNVM